MTIRNFKIGASSLAIFLVVTGVMILNLDLKNWEKQERVIEHDVHGYYAYLPLIFIYDDVRIDKQEYRQGENIYWFWPSKTKDGKKIIKYTSGLSIMYAPFFMVAHFIANNSNYLSSGFTEPYKLLLLFSALFYLIIGLDFLSRTLKELAFSNSTIFITILSIGLGTNLFAYSSQSATMAHVYSFCLFSGFVYNTVIWYKTKKRKQLIWLFLLFGLITLIRPTNGLIVLFFMLYGLSSFKDIKGRILLYKKHFLSLLLVIPIVIIVWYPQLWYWKKVTGDYLYYSYGKEGFYFLDPQILQGLFSFRKGWLVYTPIMVFSIIGLLLLKGKARKIKTGTIVFTILNIYVIFSWWCWWYGGTFGQRVMIESYAILAIPFAAFFTWIFEKGLIMKISVGLISLFFIWLNLFQTYQFEHLSLHYDGMTKELYFKQFGKLKTIENFSTYLDGPDINYWLTRNKQEDQKKAPEFIVTEQALESAKVQLVASNGKFVCANKHKGDSLIANSENPWAWETFTLYIFKDKGCALLSSRELFVSVLDDGVTADDQNKRKEEVFELVKAGEFYAFKTKNGKYLSVNQETLKLNGNAQKIGENEKFKIIGY